MINYVIKDTSVDTVTLCNYGYVYEHCTAFVIMDPHDLYKQQFYQNILKKPGTFYEHEQLNCRHMSVPKHSYQDDNAYMSSVVLYKWLTCIIIQCAISISRLKVSINTKI